MARAAEPCELTSNVVVDCPIQQCWDIYINNALVKDWAPAVSSVEADSAQLSLNCTRKSTVLIDGKSGYTVELCTALDYLKRIDFLITEETFGFSHMLTEYGFSVSFDVDGDGDKTLLVMTTRYTPKKIFASVMNSKSVQQQLLNLMTETLNGFQRYAKTQATLKPKQR